MAAVYVGVLAGCLLRITSVSKSLISDSNYCYLQTRKLGPRDIEELAPSHTASEWQSLGCDPGLPISLMSSCFQVLEASVEGWWQGPSCLSGTFQFKVSADERPANLAGSHLSSSSILQVRRQELMNFLAQFISGLRLEPRTPGSVLVLLQQCLQVMWQAHSRSSEKVFPLKAQLFPHCGKGLLSL